MSSKIQHARLSKPIMADGYIHQGNGNVIKPEVFAKALAENRLVEPGSVVIDHAKSEVYWIHHMTEALAAAVAEMGDPMQGVSMSATVEESFLGPQVLNTDEPKKA
jgi:hypothetical protein